MVMLTGTERVANSQLEKLRENLSQLTVLDRFPTTRENVYLSWGRVTLEPDTDRDPRGLLDRMFRHLVPLDKNALCCRGSDQQAQAGSM